MRRYTKDTNEPIITTPKKGDVLNFFDDGKITNSRKFAATVLNIYKSNDAPKYVQDALKNENTYWLYQQNLDGECVTDVFIECDIPDYDENHIWFARTRDGGFFSMNIQHGWQCGRLDIDGSLTNMLVC